jgi:predicted metal-dependent peptidase
MGAFLDRLVSEPAFLSRYPYYAAVLSRFDPVHDPSVHRMGVSLHGSRFYLHVNVDALVEEPQYLRGLLLHEVHHVVLGHLGHPRFADAAEPELMDLALEMSANEHIEEPLPDPIVWQHYARFGIKAGQSTLERYQRLLASRPRFPAPRPVDDHRGLTRGPPGGVEATRRVVAEAITCVPGQFGPGGRELGKEASGSGGGERPGWLAGKNPGRLLEELTGVAGPPELFLDWRTALQMFVARSRAPVHTYARPSRRFTGQVGSVPGRTYSPRVIARPRLLVALDTSQSMTQTELAEVGRQLVLVAERAALTVVECDVEILREYPFAGALGQVAGRGGTDLRPVFDPAFLGARRPDGVIYFTDGLGPFPERPPAVPVLWVLTKPGDFACPWGQRATFTRRGARMWRGDREADRPV